MSDLVETQGFLTTCILRDDPIAEDPALAARVPDFVAAKALLTPDEQVDIYRRQFWLRHRGALADDYPGLLYILGDDAFDAFARAYLAAHVPRTPSLRDLGNDSVAFAERWNGFPAAQRALAMDMLRYERAYVDVFDGPDPAPLDAAVVMALPPEAWETALLQVNPFAARLALTHPVHVLRYDVLAGTDPALPEPAAETLFVLLHREDNVVRYREMPRAAHDLLDAIAGGTALVPAAAALVAGRTPEEVASLEKLVHDWFAIFARLGIITGVVWPRP